MNDKIIICGGNGAGKSTLGRSLAGELGYLFLDIEDYYFAGSCPDYLYGEARTKEEVGRLLLQDMRMHGKFILAATKGDYGAEAESMFTHAVYVSAPREIRIERVRNRSFGRFGSRILPGGDLYDKEEQFFDMVRNRSEKELTNWIDSLSVPVIHADGTKPVAYNVEIIMNLLGDASI